jgi:hypothetical protein
MFWKDSKGQLAGWVSPLQAGGVEERSPVDHTQWGTVWPSARLFLSSSQAGALSHSALCVSSGVELGHDGFFGSAWGLAIVPSLCAQLMM